MDLFAARHNRQLPHYFSFRPDPEVEAVDALAQCCSALKPYAFPPFALIGRGLRKLEQEQVKKLILIVPVWHNQTWFPTLLTKLINLVARFQEDHHESSGRDTPTDRAKQLIPGRLQSFRTSIQEQGISGESFRITSAAWRKGTEKAYSSAWGKWVHWCNKTNPFPSSIDLFGLFD